MKQRVKLGDTNLIVQYIQTVLSESVYKRPSVRIGTESTYLLNKPLEVTGIYDADTYKCIAVYLNNYYLSEGFPYYFNTETRSFVSLQDSGLNIKQVIDSNIKASVQYPEALSLSDRVLQYFVGNIISPLSSRDSVYELQKYLELKGYSGFTYGVFDRELQLTIQRIQSREVKSILDTDPYHKFEPDDEIKVTGYYDTYTHGIVSRVGVV